MTETPSPTPPRLQVALHRAIWCLWLPFGLLIQGLSWVRRRFSLPLQRILLASLGLGAALSLWVTAPILWGRIRFGSEALPLLRKASTDEELQAALQRQAARSGLIHPLPPPEAFQVRHATRGTLDTREVAYTFTQDLTLLEMRLGVLRVSGTLVVARPEPTVPPPSPSDLP